MKTNIMNDITKDEIDMVDGGNCHCECWNDSGTADKGNVADDATCNNQCLWAGFKYHRCPPYFG